MWLSVVGVIGAMAGVVSVVLAIPVRKRRQDEAIRAAFRRTLAPEGIEATITEFRREGPDSWYIEAEGPVECVKAQLSSKGVLSWRRSRRPPRAHDVA